MPPRGYRKPARVLRSKQFTFWVTPSEKDQIRDAARRAGATPSAYVRSAALGARPRPKLGGDVEELLRHLSRVGNNLNQMREVAEKRAQAAVPLLDQARAQLRASLRSWARGGVGRSVSAQAVAELAHEGATINTIAYRAHTGRFPSLTTLRDALADLAQALKPLAP